MDYQGSVINLSDTDKNKKIYCIHPLGGEISCYNAIARILKTDFTVFGIRANRFDTDTGLTISDFASVYSSQINKMRPSSPISLIGWSMGGIIAFDMLRHLETLQIKVDKIILIDTYTPQHLFDMSLMDNDELIYHLLRLSYASSRETTALKLSIAMKATLWILIRININSRTLCKIATLFGFKNLNEDLDAFKKNIVNPDNEIHPIPKWVDIGRKLGAIPPALSNEDIFAAYNQVRLEMYAYKNFQLQFAEKTINFIKSTEGYQNKKNNSDWIRYCKKVLTNEVKTNHYNIIYDSNTMKIIKSIMLDGKI